MVQQVKFCGHILQNGTRRATPDKLEAMICSLWDLRLRAQEVVFSVLEKGHHREHHFLCSPSSTGPPYGIIWN